MGKKQNTNDFMSCATLVCICVIIFLQVLMVRYTNNKYDLTRKQEVTIHSDALLSSGVFKISFQF